MRNWNPVQIIRWFAFHIVASLPMRNWNYIWFTDWLKAWTRCEPTYEELKRICIKSVWVNVIVASLPMRNWNKDNPYLWTISSTLRAYLWGIETFCKFYPKLQLPNCCEPTYEELKHLLIFPILYFPNVASLPMRNWNRKISAKKMSLLKVASLPMRNWNIAKNLPAARATWVASLPMRNWNFLFLLIHQRWNQVASLPMRNWNTIRFKRTREIDTSCEPTYEELKLDTSVKGETVNSLLRAYLWGIETVIDKGILIFLF